MFIKYNCYSNEFDKPIPEIEDFKSISYDTDYNAVCLSLKGLDDVYFKLSFEDYKTLVNKIYSHLGNTKIELSVCCINIDTDEITNEEEFDAYIKECVGDYDNYKNQIKYGGFLI